MQANADFHPGRCAWLVAIALGHLAVLMAWRPVARHERETATQQHGEFVLLTLPQAMRPSPAELPPPPPRLRPTIPTAPASRARPAPLPVASEAARLDAPPASAEALPQSITLPAPKLASEPADPFVKPAAPAETLLEKTRKSAASVDRQLRKESLNRFATIVDEDKAAALSVTGAPPPRAFEPESFTGANGTVHKRFMLRGKMVCEEVDHIGVGGHDPFRKGSKARLVRCPK